MTKTVPSEAHELTIEQLDTAVGGTSIKFEPERTRWAKGGAREEIDQQQTVDLPMTATSA